MIVKILYSMYWFLHTKFYFHEHRQPLGLLLINTCTHMKAFTQVVVFEVDTEASADLDI